MLLTGRTYLNKPSMYRNRWLNRWKSTWFGCQCFHIRHVELIWSSHQWQMRRLILRKKPNRIPSISVCCLSESASNSYNDIHFYSWGARAFLWDARELRCILCKLFKPNGRWLQLWLSCWWVFFYSSSYITRFVYLLYILCLFDWKRCEP